MYVLFTVLSLCDAATWPNVSLHRTLLINFLTRSLSFCLSCFLCQNHLFPILIVVCCLNAEAIPYHFSPCLFLTSKLLSHNTHVPSLITEGKALPLCRNTPHRRLWLTKQMMYHVSCFLSLSLLFPLYCL